MIETKEIEYRDGELTCRGFMAYNNELHLPLPSVMVAPDWGGRGEAACNKAIQLAKMGYVGFAIDLYGQARVGKTKEEKRELMTPLKQNRDTLATRMLKAFDKVANLAQVDRSKIAAIGYCFGGLAVLDLARTGIDIKGVVSFHGLLSAPDNSQFKCIPAKILVLHGFDDPLVPAEDLKNFPVEMTTRNADWQLHCYGLTAHSFTDPNANDDEMGLHYNKTADRRSWQSTVQFLEDIFS